VTAIEKGDPSFGGNTPKERLLFAIAEVFGGLDVGARDFGGLDEFVDERFGDMVFFFCDCIEGVETVADGDASRVTVQNARIYV
jgi:hypothetical protein